MTEDAKPAPDMAAWGHIRMRYEQAVETVAQIATTIGLSPHALTKHAKAQGWLMRSAAKRARKSESTRETLKRLKEILQKRLSKLERELDGISEDISALSNERDIRATNTLVRTLEKVLELEHKDLKQRSQRSRDSRRLNAAEREELANRIAKLQTGDEELRGRIGSQAGDSAAAGLALLGEG
jgi:chromosome segregation ATPase